MRDLLPKIDEWTKDGKEVALATVVAAWGSAPRPLGAKMAVSSAGDVAGSVSGGCVEAAVAEEAAQVLGSGETRLVSYGVSNETAWSVGLSCGGKIDIFVEPLSEAFFDLLAERLRADLLSVRAVVLAGDTAGRQLLVDAGGPISGSLGATALDARAIAIASRHIGDLTSGRHQTDCDGKTVDLFIDLLAPRPKLIVVGAVHVAIHLVALARRLGYQTVVVDPRTAFATPERFRDADRLTIEWPGEALAEISIDETTCLAFLSHDLKIDLPGLALALRSPALYIGALGSRKTHAKRVAALEELGFSAQDCARIHAPIGFDLGGRKAEEIALAIMAEIVAVRYGRISRS